MCQVCGERAGKHSYYGGQVCPSCRAFFRRSVQSRLGRDNWWGSTLTHFDSDITRPSSARRGGRSALST